MRVLIIGGGASGMIAALTAAQRHTVTLLERQSRLGRKLAATGNGRCNLTNLHAGLPGYHGEAPEFVLPALRGFSVSDTLSWFEALGLVTVSEPSGRVYPFSDQAGSVVDVLRLAVEQSGIRFETGAEVTELAWRGDAFFARTAERQYAADAVIVACGGKAGEGLGGTELGYRLLQGFGHTLTKLRPSLVQLKTEPSNVRALKGIRAEAGVLLVKNGAVLAKTKGEVQFTEYGLSGPAIFEISRAASMTDGTTVLLDLMPLLSEEALSSMLSQKAKRYPGLTLENLLTGILQNRLGRVVVRASGYELTKPLSSLRGRDFARIAATAKAFSFPVLGAMGMDKAQVTAGGVRTSEFDPETLESRLCPCLYDCGEVLDIDGDCGGLNLQWAWSSGRLAGLLKGNNHDPNP